MPGFIAIILFRLLTVDLLLPLLGLPHTAAARRGGPARIVCFNTRVPTMHFYEDYILGIQQLFMMERLEMLFRVKF